MIGEKVITAAGSRDGDSVSRMTDGTAVVDPESQGSGATGTPSPTAVGIFRSSGVSTDSFQIRAPPRDDDSMSGIYTTDGVSMTQEERFRARVLAEERKILKKFSLESGSKSEESYPEVSFMPTTLITAKTPSPDKKKKQKWSPFVGSVGTHDFDLDSLESDKTPSPDKKQTSECPPFVGLVGTNVFDFDSIASHRSMRGGEIYRALGMKSMDASSPMGTEKTHSPSTLGSAAVLNFSYDDAVQAEGCYAGSYSSSERERKAAAAATSQMRPRVCGCRLKELICVLACVVVIALALAVGAVIATNHMGGGDEGAGASQNTFRAPSPSAPTPSGQMPTLGQTPTLAEAPLFTLAPSAAPPSPTFTTGSLFAQTPAPSDLPPVTNTASPSVTPTSGPTNLTNTKVPSSRPAIIATETARPVPWFCRYQSCFP